MGKRILIIDDDPTTCQETKKLLNQGDYEVLSAANGQEGLRKLRIIKHDLILLDLVLPDQSGFKIAQQLKNIPMCENIPIIAVSLKKEDIDKHVALKSGIMEYVEKPIDYARLLHLMHEALQK